MVADFATRSYFFDQGLRFACRRCGACCTGAPGTIYVAPAELAPIATCLGLALPDLIHTYLHPFRDSYSIREDNRGHCLFFDAGCAIYAARPMQCRTFPFWFRNLRSEARWRDVQRECPGIGQGPRHSREAILALAGATMMI